MRPAQVEVHVDAPAATDAEALTTLSSLTGLSRASSALRVAATIVSPRARRQPREAVAAASASHISPSRMRSPLSRCQPSPVAPMMMPVVSFGQLLDRAERLRAGVEDHELHRIDLLDVRGRDPELSPVEAILGIRAASSE